MTSHLAGHEHDDRVGLGLGLGLQGRETCVRFLQAADQELRAAAVRRERERGEYVCVCDEEEFMQWGTKPPGHADKEGGGQYVRTCRWWGRACA